MSTRNLAAIIASQHPTWCLLVQNTETMQVGGGLQRPSFGRQVSGYNNQPWQCSRPDRHRIWEKTDRFYAGVQGTNQ